MKIYLLALAPMLALAQFPTQVNVTVTKTPDYLGQFLQSSRDLNQILMNNAQVAVQQNAINETRQHNLAEEEMERANLIQQRSDYAAVHSNEAPWRQNQDVKDAIATCHAAHDDCEKLDGMMLMVSRALRPDWTQLSMKEYVEALYAVAKNAAFAQQARDIVLAIPAPQRTVPPQ